MTLLSSLLKEDLQNLILDRKESEYLFVTQTGKKYSIRTVQKIFSNALSKSQLKRASTCHSLRHSFATHLVESGVDIKTVKQLLGHKSIKTTMIYINLANPENRTIISPL